MEGVSEIFHNQILVVALLACFTAQGLKVIIE
ncbi:MAG: divergent PAP2 family protein, partial [Xenococcus sp. (in: cyanobacteria)]